MLGSCKYLPLVSSSISNCIESLRKIITGWELPSERELVDLQALRSLPRCSTAGDADVSIQTKIKDTDMRNAGIVGIYPNMSVLIF